jgi:phage terminase small subunit
MADASGRPPRPPNIRQRRFIAEYLLGGDPRAAAVAAGYAPSTAKRNASVLLRRPSVAAMVRRELDARAERTRIAADRIVLELARVAFSDISRIADWGEGGGLVVRPLAELSEGDRAAVARITRHGGHVSIALHDKIRALDALGKYFKLWGKHADTLGPPAVAPGGNLRAAALERARAALKANVERIIAERDHGEREAKQREEADWAAAWRAAFSAD